MEYTSAPKKRVGLKQNGKSFVPRELKQRSQLTRVVGELRFKMHLRPRAIRDKDNPLKSLPPLPVDKTVIQVLADYLKYLLVCSKSYIEETQPDGEEFWKSVERKIEFVLSHPNGWEGLQQSQMRKAAVLAGLIPKGPAGQKRISFVTEGEASLHFAIYHGLPKGVSEVRQGSTLKFIPTISRASNDD